MLATGALGLPAYAELPPSVASALKNAGIPAQNVAVFVQAVEGSSPIPVSYTHLDVYKRQLHANHAFGFFGA